MGPEYAHSNHSDEDKTREQLLAELQDLRDQLAAIPGGEGVHSPLAAIVNNSDDAIISKALDGTITGWNKGAERLYGYSAREVVGRHVWVIVPPDRMGELEEILDKIRRGEPIERYETVRVRKDGRRVDVSVTISPIMDAGGRIVGASTIGRDITERKQVEETVRKNEQFLSNVFECIQDGISILDKDLNIVRTNHMLEELHPYMMPLAGKKCYYAYHTRDAPCPVCPSVRAIKEKTMQKAIVPLSGEDGRQRGWLEIYSYPMVDEDGNVTGVVEHVRDITERKRAEEALRESNSRLSLAQEAGQVGVFDWDLTTNKAVWTPELENIFGIPHGQFEKLYDGWARRVHADDLPRIERFFKEWMESGRDKEEWEYRFIKDGEVRWISAKGRIIYCPDGTPLRMIGTNLDITERKRAEEALASERSQLLSIFESIDDIVYVTDPYTYEVLYANKAMKETFGGDLVRGVCYREFQHLDAPCDFCTNPIILKEPGMPYKWEYYNPTVDRYYLITDRIIKWPDGRDVRFEIAKDITDRRRAEEALRESEEKYRILVEHSKDISWKIDLAGTWTFISGNSEGAIGLKPAEVIGRKIWDFLAPECHDLVRDKLRRRAAGEDLPPYEVLVIGIDGRRIPFEVSTAPILDGSGKIAGVQGISRDITDRKRAEEALRESEEKFRQMAENIGEVFFIFSPDWKQTIYVSPAYERVWGRPLDDVYRDPMDWLEGVHPDDQRLPLAVVHRSIGGDVSGDDRVEFRVMRPDGSVRWIFARTFPVRDKRGELVGITGIAEDITERKRAEDALKESEEFNRSTLDSLPMNIAVLDELGTIVFVNRSWMEFGRDNNVCPVESIGAGTNYIDVCRRARGEYSDEALAAVEGILSVLNGQHDTFEMEYPCHSPDKKRWFTMRVSRIHASAFRGVIVIHTDITMRKLFEEALAEQKAQTELYLDLMGHDINNMHQIALGYLELAQNMSPATGQGEFLDKSIEVLQRGGQLIQNVRKLQKLREGVFQTQEVDVCTLLGDVRREFGAVPNKAITLNTGGRDHCLVRANELLHDVFANLVSNAIKHTGDHADIAINMDVREENGIGYCRVIVEDNGPGIPEDSKGKIFNRMHKGTARGMGLGLYLVKTLVDSYGGRVWAEDRVKGDHTKGARFVVMLPAVDK